jgi:hypothetical protein
MPARKRTKGWSRHSWQRVAVEWIPAAALPAGAMIVRAFEPPGGVLPTLTLELVFD